MLIALLAAVSWLPGATTLVTRTAKAGDPPATSPAKTSPSASTVLLRALTPPPDVTLGKTLPDPPAIVQKQQWVYDFRYATGDLYLLGIHKVELPAPQPTPRAMGRFAMELYEGGTLLERARFDFPMLGDGLGAAPSATPAAGTKLPITGKPLTYSKVSSRIGVMFPAFARGTRVEIVDRATNRRWPLPWPPTEMTGQPADAPEAGPPTTHGD